MERARAEQLTSIHGATPPYGAAAEPTGRVAVGAGGGRALPPLPGGPAGGAGGYQAVRPGGETGPPPKPATVRHSGPKVGRNDPCPCGSGKKYKFCHGASE
jgi:preprotein translocase subunit SecA